MASGGDAWVDPRPTGTRWRQPATMKIGREFKIDQVVQIRSKFIDKTTNKKPMKLVPIFTDFKVKFSVWTPRQYDDKDSEFIDRINKEIAEGKNIRVSNYGVLGLQNEVHLLEDGEEVDWDMIKGIADINEVEETAGPSPKKLKKESSDEK